MGGWADRVDHVTHVGDGLQTPAVLVCPDGYVGRADDDQHDLLAQLPRWFGDE